MSFDVFTSLRIGEWGHGPCVRNLLPAHVAQRTPQVDSDSAAPTDKTQHPLAAHVPLWLAHVHRLVDASRLVHAALPEWTAAPTAHDIISSDAVRELCNAAQAGTPLRASLRVSASGSICAISAPLSAPPDTPPTVRLDTQETRIDGPFTKLKTSARKTYDDARARVSGTLVPGNGVFDVLLWHRDGDERVVTESSIANLIVESPDGQLFTPTFEHLLPGLLVQELCRMGLVTQRRITVADLVRWSGTHTLYLCNAVRGMFRIVIE